MTTIAYRDGVVAADTRSTRGGFILPGSSPKLFRMLDGGVAAVTGDYAPGVSFIEWLKAPDGKPEPSLGEATVIRFRADRTITIYECDGSYAETAPFCAWGSGMTPALAALHAGLSAADAVKIAMLIDPYSGGDVDEVTVGA